jgi:parallel beta-helix repeat protein
MAGNGIIHKYVSAKPDSNDTSLVQPSNWNAEHVGGTGRSNIAAGNASVLERSQTDLALSGNAVADTLSINSAILAASVAGGGKITVPAGALPGGLIAKSNVWLQGAGIGATSIVTTDTQDGITLNGVSNFVLSDMYLNGLANATSGKLIAFGQTTANTHNIFRNLWLSGYIGLGDLYNGADYSSDNYFIECNFWAFKHAAIKMSAVNTGYWYFDKCVFDQSTLTAPQKAACFTSNVRFDGFAGICFTKCGWVNNAQDGAIFYNGNNIHFSDCDFDHAEQANIRIDTVNYVAMVNTRIAVGCTLAGVTGHACLELNIVQNFKGTNLTVGGVIQANCHGVMATGCTDVMINNSDILTNTGAGVYFSSSTNVKLIGNTIIGNYYAIYEDGTTDNNTIIGNTLTGNSVASTIIGSNRKISNNSGFITENSGASSGTGSQQTVAHGLSFTPTRQQIKLSAGSATANPYHSAPPDATNIYVTAASSQAWYWST